ncbi:MAG TPA: alpha/beta hydrolase domain-containing protein [Myxococcales bacterium]|nr:alpha/beta hydrolase domain-containing protein [Myxococcales bacterium]
MKRKDWIAAVAVALVSASAEARVTRVVISSQQVVAGGAPFGDRGAYEKLTGTVYFEVDPRNPHNAAVFDLDKALRNRAGKVEFSADMVILRPVDRSKANGRLFFEVNNRGNKIAPTMLNSTPPTANNNNPTTAADFGNGWLQRQGYIIAWVGWGADIAPGNSRLTVSFPIAMENGKPITERILTEFCDRNFAGGTPFTLPLSGGTAFNSYPAVATDKSAAQAELRVRPSDSPRPSGPEIPAGELVPDSQWSFASCPAGPPGVPSTTDICLAGGFQNDRVYELRYRATNSPVMGLGYVTSRDLVSFLRHAKVDDDLKPNPAAGATATLCVGISSSGMYYRDYLYQGFNADEQGRRVCDGVFIDIPGVQKLFLNYRFAQPNPFTVQHRERYVPDTNFPRTYAVRHNPLFGPGDRDSDDDDDDRGGGRHREELDGILKRPSTDPKVIHTDSATEWWQFRSSLVDTDEEGTRDLRQPHNVRRYLFASKQHFPTKGAAPTRGTANRQCQQVNNQSHYGPSARALLVALDEWARHDRAPPASRVPRLADGTLVAPDQASTGFPSIPGVTYSGRYNGSGDRDFGPRVEGNAGVIDNLIPVVLSRHRILVPRVDAIGNDVGGIRQPEVEVPTATLTGWNTRTAEFTDGDLCDLNGMTIPLKRTRAEKAAAGDPRPSLEDLYRGHDDYVSKVAASARALKAQGLMLQEDVDAYIAEAMAAPVP